MGKTTPALEKSTLDKDLDKLTLNEEASLFVLKSSVGLGLGFIFLIFVMIIAASAVSEAPGAIIVVAAAAIAGYMAMNIGANDVTNNVGAAVGARAMTMTGALVIAAIFEIAGALFAGGRVVSTIEGGLVDATAFTDSATLVWVMMSALISAAVWINIATWCSAPISTTHAIVGSILGGGIAAVGFSSVQWLSLGGITLSWMLSPFIGGGVAAGLLFFIKTFIIYREDKIAGAVFWIPILLACMGGVFTAYFALIGLERVYEIPLVEGLAVGLVVGILIYLVSRRSVARRAVGLENRNQSLRPLFHLPLVVSAALLSFAHGSNDVSNAVGPLSAIVANVGTLVPAETADVAFWVLLIGALGISAGLLLYGPKLIRVVGEEITKLNPVRAFCVALATAITVIFASTFGLPVSTTHIAVGAVFGIGFFREWYTRNSKLRLDYVRRKTGQSEFQLRAEHGADETRRRQLVRRSHFMTIVGAWIITVPASALLSALLYILFSAIFL
ncbi:PiT family inorganic phosphate transporter [Rhizobium sp. PP-WC-2G-219]|nr:PiT family inorganic phosphate transporter [Rhizobium sp. PP-WC-2G-219]